MKKTISIFALVSLVALASVAVTYTYSGLSQPKPWDVTSVSAESAPAGNDRRAIHFADHELISDQQIADADSFDEVVGDMDSFDEAAADSGHAHDHGNHGHDHAVGHDHSHQDMASNKAADQEAFSNGVSFSDFGTVDVAGDEIAFAEPNEAEKIRMRIGHVKNEMGDLKRQQERLGKLGEKLSAKGREAIEARIASRIDGLKKELQLFERRLPRLGKAGDPDREQHKASMMPPGYDKHGRQRTRLDGEQERIQASHKQREKLLEAIVQLRAAGTIDLVADMEERALALQTEIARRQLNLDEERAFLEREIAASGGKSNRRRVDEDDDRRGLREEYNRNDHDHDPFAELDLPHREDLDRAVKEIRTDQHRLAKLAEAIERLHQAGLEDVASELEKRAREMRENIERRQRELEQKLKRVRREKERGHREREHEEERRGRQNPLGQVVREIRELREEVHGLRNEIRELHEVIAGRDDKKADGEGIKPETSVDSGSEKPATEEGEAESTETPADEKPANDDIQNIQQVPAVEGPDFELGVPPAEQPVSEPEAVKDAESPDRAPANTKDLEGEAPSTSQAQSSNNKSSEDNALADDRKPKVKKVLRLRADSATISWVDDKWGREKPQINPLIVIDDQRVALHEKNWATEIQKRVVELRNTSDNPIHILARIEFKQGINGGLAQKLMNVLNKADVDEIQLGIRQPEAKTKSAPPQVKSSDSQSSDKFRAVPRVIGLDAKPKSPTLGVVATQPTSVPSSKRAVPQQAVEAIGTREVLVHDSKYIPSKKRVETFLMLKVRLVPVNGDEKKTRPMLYLNKEKEPIAEGLWAPTIQKQIAKLHAAAGDDSIKLSAMIEIDSKAKSEVMQKLTNLLKGAGINQISVAARAKSSN